MASDRRKSTTGRTPKADAAASLPGDDDSGSGEKRAAKRGKSDPAKGSKRSTQRARKPAQKPKRQSFHTEIAALADATAALPSPWRERAIQVVRGVVALFGQAWRELRRRITPKDANEASDALDDAGTIGHD
jgi:hypothetical protein